MTRHDTARHGATRHPGPGPAHLAQVRPARPLTCRGRPCASLLRLRGPGPPARHISRGRGLGGAGGGRRGEGGLRVPGVQQRRHRPEKNVSSPKKRSISPRGPASGSPGGFGGRWGATDGPGPSRGLSGGGGGVRGAGAGARRSPPERRRQPPASAPQPRGHRARGTCAPRRAPGAGPVRGVNGTAGAPRKSPAARPSRCGAGAAPSAGASPGQADGGAGGTAVAAGRARGVRGRGWPGAGGEEAEPWAPQDATRGPSRRGAGAAAPTRRPPVPLPGSPAPGGRGRWIGEMEGGALGCGARKTRTGAAAVTETRGRGHRSRPARDGARGGRGRGAGRPQNPGWRRPPKILLLGPAGRSGRGSPHPRPTHPSWSEAVGEGRASGRPGGARSWELGAGFGEGLGEPAGKKKKKTGGGRKTRVGSRGWLARGMRGSGAAAPRPIAPGTGPHGAGRSLPRRRSHASRA